MATAPKAPIGQIESIPLRPVYGDPNAARGTFGSGGLEAAAGAAQQIAQAADSLIEAQGRIRERNDAVNRAREFLPFKSFGSESWTALQLTDDIANPVTVQKYRAMLDAKREEILSAHTGSANSRAALEVRLLEQQTEFMNAAGAASVTAGRKAVGDQLQVDLSGIASRVANDPSTFAVELDNWNQSVENMRPVLTPDEERLWLRQGPAVMVEAVIDTMLSQPDGDLEVQRLLSNTPALMGMMLPEQQVEVRKRIRMTAAANAEARNKVYNVGRDELLIQNGRIIAQGPVTPPPKTKADELIEVMNLYKAANVPFEQNDFEKVVGGAFSSPTEGPQAQYDFFRQEWMRLSGGIEPPPEVAAKWLGADGVGSPKTIGERLGDVNAIRAKQEKPALTEDQVNAVMGIVGSPKKYSEKLKEISAVIDLSADELTALGGLKGAVETDRFTPAGMKELATRLAPRYAVGDTTPAEDREFEAAVTYLSQPETIIDPTTKLAVVGPPPVLPPFVTRAMELRGFAVPATGAPQSPSAQGTPGGAQAPSAATGAQPAPGAAPGGAQAPAQAPGTKTPAQVEPDTPQTIYELTELLTGPVASVKPLMGRVPVPGLADVGGQETIAQSAMALRAQALVNAIRDARWYNEAEDKRLREEISIEGKTIDSVQAFRGRLIGIAKSLDERLKNDREKINSVSSTQEERQRAIETVNAIEDFRATLLPPIVESVEELALYLRDHPDTTGVLIPNRLMPEEQRSEAGYVLWKRQPAAGAR
jgi:hypothetical protein